MFTAEGAERVQQIAETAHQLVGRVDDNQLWQWFYSNLELLRRSGYHEATDTEVRELVWNWLVEQQWIDPQQVNYWFFIGPGFDSDNGLSKFTQWSKIND